MRTPTVQREIDAYLRRLVGGQPFLSADSGCADLLDEVRDHVLSHAEQLMADGVMPHVAVSAALRDFGQPEKVGPALRADLLRPHLRRLSATLLLIGVALGAGWLYLLQVAPRTPWTHAARPIILGVLDKGADLCAAAAVPLAIASLGLLVLPSRWCTADQWRRRCQHWSFRTCVASVILGLAAACQLLGYLAVRGMLAPASLSWPAVSLAGLLTLSSVPLVARPLRAVVAAGFIRPGASH